MAMQRNTALSTAAALTLTVAGGVSALFFTVGTGADAGPTPEPTVVTEYVDAMGNPVAAPVAAPEALAPEVVVQTESTDEPETVSTTDGLVGADQAAAYAQDPGVESEYPEETEYSEEDEAYEEYEYEDGDEYEDEDDD